jgi:mRNA interferase HigB
VRLISKRQVREFVARFPVAQAPLQHWCNAVQVSTWWTPTELRMAFGSVDFVGELTVFNVGGNKFRLIAFIDYRRQILYIKHILTHSEYDKEKWKP